MKKHIMALVSFYLISLASAASVFASPTPPPLVQTTAVASKESPLTVTTTAPVEQKVEYVLPYPGILPTHPLYRLKLIRDWIMERLIVDPLRKAEFYILQADKYLSMAIVFSSRNASDEAAKAAGTAELFMAKAYASALQTKTTGKEVPGHVFDRIERSTGKHIEVLGELWQIASGSTKTAFGQALEAVKNVQAQIGSLR